MGGARWPDGTCPRATLGTDSVWEDRGLRQNVLALVFFDNRMWGRVAPLRTANVVVEGSAVRARWEGRRATEGLAGASLGAPARTANVLVRRRRAGADTARGDHRWQGRRGVAATFLSVAPHRRTARPQREELDVYGLALDGSDSVGRVRRKARTPRATASTRTAQRSSLWTLVLSQSRRHRARGHALDPLPARSFGGIAPGTQGDQFQNFESSPRPFNDSCFTLAQELFATTNPLAVLEAETFAIERLGPRPSLACAVPPA